MITNEERKQVAARLREDVDPYTFAEVFGFSWTDESDWHWCDVAAKVADFIEPEPERTCKNLSTRKDGFACSVCECEAVGCMIDDFGSWDNPLLFCHCPNCGAKVVK